MHTLIAAFFVVLAAFFIAGHIALLKNFGSSDILRFAEERRKATGVTIVIISWFLLLLL